MIHQADYYEILAEDKVKCTLCPNDCIIKPDNSGICKVRKNSNGILYSEVYGKISGYHFDPIEKKPLYHFFPGTTILSVGGYGCNLKCQFCQNCEISQIEPDNLINYRSIEKNVILRDSLLRKDNIGIAYTYNEPTIWFEFMRDLAIDNKKNGLYNVMVSNGYISLKPLEELVEIIDAFNIDLKAFTEEFYRKNTKSHLKPVLETLKKIRQAGKHLEITNLVIPFENDDSTTFKEMIYWINENLGKNSVLHLSRYFPNYKFNNSPTSSQKLLEFFDIASEFLDYVYLGNINLDKEKDTSCPSCGTKVITRYGFNTEVIGIDKDGNCTKCNHALGIIL